MAATHYGINRQTIYPQPDFRASRDSSGKWSGSRSYKLDIRDFDNESVRDKFAYGTALTTIDTTLGIYWEFLTITDIDVEDETGGFKMVSVTAEGVSDNELSGDSDREVVYEMRGVLTERDIMLNPNLVAAVEIETDRAAMSAYIDGKMEARPGEQDPGTEYILRNMSDQAPTYFTDTGPVKWFAKIHTGLRTYLAPSIEWIKTTTNVDPLSDAEYQDLGWIDVPSSNSASARAQPPGLQGNATWLKTSINEVRGEGSITTSETWLASDPDGWDVDIYTQPS